MTRTRAPATLLVLHVLLYYQLEVRTSELEEDVTHPRDRALEGYLLERVE